MIVLAHDVIRAARKEHRCNWCDETIEVGTSYVRQRCVDAGEAWTYRAHEECNAAASTLHNDDLECLGYVTLTRGCTCERGSHEAGLCGDTPRKPKSAGGTP